MKKLLLIFSFLLICSNLFSQTDDQGSSGTDGAATNAVGGGGGDPTQGKKLVFDYDAAGNQIKRSTIVLSGKPANENVKDISEITDADLQETDIYNDIKYYPNPVLEELYVKWTNIEVNYVSEIQIYSMNGQQLKTFSNLKHEDDLTISFQSYSEGLYNLMLIYHNGEKKTLKIIKSH